MSEPKQDVPQNNEAPGSSHDVDRCPFPIPMGWYFVDFSKNLGDQEVRNVNLLDQEWVLFRTEQGNVGMNDPYCPHLGAHIGHGGEVCGENIRCPFHHWQFDCQAGTATSPTAGSLRPLSRKNPFFGPCPARNTGA